MRPLSYLALIVFLVAITETALYAVAKKQTSELGSMIESVFQSEKNMISVQLVTQSLLDLEKLKLISCLKVTDSRTGRVFFQTSEDQCRSTFLLGNSSFVAMDGSSWNIFYKAQMGASYKILAWSLRFAVPLIGLLLLFAVRSRRDELEGQLLRAREKATWSRRVGHDLRSPLSALNLALRSKQVELRSAGPLVDKALLAIDQIAADLLREGPAPIAGSVRVSLSIPETHKLICDVLELKNVEYPEYADRISYSGYQGSFQGQLMVDPVGLRRCLSNLVNNAIEAQHPARMLDVSVLFDDWNDSASISVTDNGIGFPNTLTEARTQDIRSHGKSRGQGLGLSGAKHWITSLGGELVISKNRQHGSKVSVSFPKSVHSIQS